MLLFSSWRSQGVTSLFYDLLSNLKAKRTGHGLYCFRVINSLLSLKMRWRFLEKRGP
jgi:hypothetical protein